VLSHAWRAIALVVVAAAIEVVPIGLDLVEGAKRWMS
jgi:hypothetical protein